jgi:hypothetical protein
MITATQNVTDLDDFLANDQQTVKNSKSSVKAKPVKKQRLSDYNITSTSTALSRHAKEKLEIYLKRSPQYKIIESQLKLLTLEYQKYKSLGKQDLCDRTQVMLIELTGNKNKFIKLYKNNNWKADKEKNMASIEASPELKLLKEKRKQLETQISLINPLSLISKLRDYRKMLNINERFEDELELDIDDVLDNPVVTGKNLKQEYYNFCGHIAELLDISAVEVSEMNLKRLLDLLKSKISQETINNLKSELDIVKFEASTEISKIKGYEDITNIIFDIFDFDTVPEEQPKEMLAASNVDYVKAIAYNQCIKLNMLHNIDDAIAYGLMGLSIAIDKWYKIQKLKDSAVTFNGFAQVYITNNIRKGLIELGSGGMLNKSSLATAIHKRKKYFEAFIASNPELKDIPEELLESMVDGLLDDKPATVITEGSYADMVGGQQGENADIWANAVVSDMNDAKFIESKLEYENLLKSFKGLFGLFEVKTNKDTGLKQITNTKLFDKYDYKLFKLCYGLEFKREVNTTEGDKVADRYNQSDIADIMSAFYAANGIKNKTFSQAAINYRISQLNEKIKAAIEDNPKLKLAFEHIYNYFLSNTEALNLLSNNREEIDMNIDDKVLQDEDSSNLLNTKLVSNFKNY